MRRRLFSRKRKGSVLVLVALAILALFGMVAFSFDWGLAVMAAQYAQDVADASALAAAQYDVSDPTDAETNITNVVAANNLTHVPAATWSTSTTYFYASGTTVPKWGTLASGQEAVKVYISVPVHYHFAPIIGLTGTTITRYATALRSGGESIATIFAAGLPTSALHGCTLNGAGNLVQAGNVYSNAEISVTGAGNTVNGYSHADSKYTVSGAGNKCVGPAQYVTTWSNTGAGNTFSPVQVASAVRSFPATYNTTNSFGTYTYDVPSYTISGAGISVPPGTYYVTGNVSIGGATVNLTGVTMVATGTITVSGASIGSSSPAAANGCTFYSTSTSANAINISGASGTWTGLIYAPNGGVSFTGAGISVKNGSLWGQSVAIAGAGYTVNPTAGTWGTPNVSLIQ